MGLVWVWGWLTLAEEHGMSGCPLRCPGCCVSQELPFRMACLAAGCAVLPAVQASESCRGGCCCAQY